MLNTKTKWSCSNELRTQTDFRIAILPILHRLRRGAPRLGLGEENMGSVAQLQIVPAREKTMKAWILRLLGYEYVRVGYIGCCRWWTNCEHWKWVRKTQTRLDEQP
jgi:hypothetical protein